jgi:hypothetical protein
MPRVPVMTADPGRTATVERGQVTCRAFPIVVITSNAEREFPPAFLRRCVQVNIPIPDSAKLAGIVAAQLGPAACAARATATQAADAWGTGAAPRRRALAGRGAGRRLQRVHGDRVAYRRRVGTSCWCARPPSAT